MNYKNKKLRLKQVSEQLQPFKKLDANTPSKGFIHAIRTALNMTTTQLAKRLGVSQQAVSSLEKREAEGSITLSALKTVGRALDLELVYGFVSSTSLEQMVEQRARALAIEIVQSASTQMILENQKVKEQRLKEAIENRTQELKNSIPNTLWD